MRARSAQIQSFDGRAVLRPARHRPHEKKLLEIQVAVKNVALRQTIGSLKVQWGDNLHRFDGARNVGSKFHDFLHDTTGEQIPVLIPRSFREAVRHVLHETSQDVFADGSETVIDVGSYDAVCPQLLGNLAEFGNVVAAFRKFERIHETEKRPLLWGSSRWSGLELWFFGKNHVYFGAGPGHLDAANLFAKVFRQIVRINQAEKCAFRIGIRKHDARFDFRVVLEDHALRAAISNVNTRYAG